MDQIAIMRLKRLLNKASLLNNPDKEFAALLQSVNEDFADVFNNTKVLITIDPSTLEIIEEVNS